MGQSLVGWNRTWKQESAGQWWNNGFEVYKMGRRFDRDFFRDRLGGRD